jgi:hypothetical protein
LMEKNDYGLKRRRGEGGRRSVRGEDVKRTGRRCKTCKQPSELPWKGRHASILRVSPLPSKYRDASGGMPSGVREERGADASSEAIRPSNCTLNKTSSACCEAVNRYMHAVPRSLLECKAAKGLHAHSQQRPLWPRLGPPRASASSWCLAGSIAWLPTGTCGSVPSERPIAMIIAKVATRLTAGPPLLRPAAHTPHSTTQIRQAPSRTWSTSRPTPTPSLPRRPIWKLAC